MLLLAKLNALLVVCIYYAKAGGAAEQVQQRIVGGVASTIETVPYLVYLRRYGSFICGGTLINANFVLTAAHCVQGYPASAFTAHGGTSYLNTNGVMRNVARICITAGFNLQTLTADAAVLRLASPMTAANIQPIPLCTQTLFVNDMVRISGWGLESEFSSTVPNQVRTADIRMLSRATCQQAYGNIIQLTDTMICAAVLGQADSCSGDSGGPLVRNGEVCGIVSFGIGCANPRYPGIYTSVTRMQPFITQCMSTLA